MNSDKKIELAEIVSMFGVSELEYLDRDFKILNDSPFYKAGEKCKLAHVDASGQFWMEFDTERCGGFIWHVVADDVVKVE